MKALGNIVFGLVLVSALGACSSDDDDNDNDTSSGLITDSGDVVPGADNGGVVPGPDTGEVPGGSVVETDTSAIAGLWDSTETIDGLEDVYYVRITDDGMFVSIDYDGDTYDQGENCYYIETASIQSIGGNQYVIQYDDEFEDSETYTMIRNGNTLSVSFVDTYDDDEDGNTTETLTVDLPLLTGVDPQFDEC